MIKGEGKKDGYMTGNEFQIDNARHFPFLTQS